MLLVTHTMSEITVKLKIRCPACAKLYEVGSSDIQTELPLFQCCSCQCHFGFEYPPKDPSQILCFPVDIQKATRRGSSVESVNAQRQELTKPCPKCGALSSRKSKECYSCHILFERVDGLPKDISLKAQPSLVKKWKNLIERIEDEKLHDEFILSCHQLDALRFAAFKYEELKSAQGGDPLCDRMLARINALLLVNLSQKPLSNLPENKKSKWQKYLFWGPFGLSALLILLGMVNLGHRNLIGVGVALSFMTAGLIVMIRGKISASDFVD
jgi:hypothetical protein